MLNMLDVKFDQQTLLQGTLVIILLDFILMVNGVFCHSISILVNFTFLGILVWLGFFI